MARINVHGADKWIDSRHSSPTAATFIRAGDGDAGIAPLRRGRGRFNPHGWPVEPRHRENREQKSRPTTNRSPTRSVSLGELIKHHPQTSHQQYGSRRPAAAVGDSDPAIRRQRGDRRPAADDGKARGFSIGGRVIGTCRAGARTTRARVVGEIPSRAVVVMRGLKRQAAPDPRIRRRYDGVKVCVRRTRCDAVVSVRSNRGGKRRSPRPRR